MSTNFTCDDKDTLIAYLYGELDVASSRAVQAHLAACADCAAEVSALGDVRAELGAWVAPQVNLDFAIVKKSELPSNVLRPARWWDTVPRWAHAAAALLLVAAGASIANVQVRSGPDGVSVSTGWMQPRAASAPAGALAQGATADDWKPALTALEQSLRGEIRAAREQALPARVTTPVDEATIRRVQQLIGDAEQRHERALAQRFIDFERDINVQRRADLMRITNSFGAYDRQLMQQRQLMNNVIRTSVAPQ